METTLPTQPSPRSNDTNHQQPINPNSTTPADHFVAPVITPSVVIEAPVLEEGIKFWAFVDNENFPGFYKNNDITIYEKFFIFVGSTQRGINTELVMRLQPKGEMVKYILIEEVGRNNLDMHLLFYLGIAHQMAGPDIRFIVFSSDNDFDTVINHCNLKLGRKCSRIIDQSTALSNGIHSGEMIKENTEEFDLLYAKLLFHMAQINASSKTSLPTRKPALTNFIISTVRFSGKTFQPEKVLERLMNENLITIDSKLRVTYHLDGLPVRETFEFKTPTNSPQNNKSNSPQVSSSSHTDLSESVITESAAEHLDKTLIDSIASTPNKDSQTSTTHAKGSNTDLAAAHKNKPNPENQASRNARRRNKNSNKPETTTLSPQPSSQSGNNKTQHKIQTTTQAPQPQITAPTFYNQELIMPDFAI